MDSMDLSPYTESSSTVAAHFAKEVMDRWGIGYAKCEVGVVLLLAVKDRQVQSRI